MEKTIAVLRRFLAIFSNSCYYDYSCNFYIVILSGTKFHAAKLCTKKQFLVKFGWGKQNHFFA